MIFKYEFLTKLAFYIASVLAFMFGLTWLWNRVMPVLGIAELTVWQFTALFIVIHSLTFEIVDFKKPNKQKEES